MNSCLSTENNSQTDHIGLMVGQDMENSGSQLSSDDLCTRVVLRKILSNFSNSELRGLSLVSKLWHSEARSLMEKRGTLTAKLSANHTCRDLAALVSDLQEMNAAPISLCGITVPIGFSLWRECRYPFEFKPEPNYDVILDQLKWRNLSVILNCQWGTFRYFPPCVLVDQILKKKCGDLVEIKLVLHDITQGGLFVEDVVQDCNFKRLKTLKILTPDCTRPKKTELNFVRVLISRAPVLEKVYASQDILVENLLEGSSAVLVPAFHFDTYPCHNSSLFSATILRQIRVESLILGVYGPSFYLEEFNRVMPELLKNSCETLKTVQMDLLATLPLMNYGIVLGRVRELKIHVRPDFLSECESEILELVSAFNFTRIFPNLSKVQVNIQSILRGSAHLANANKFVEHGHAAVWEYMLDRASRIKHLEILGSTCHISFLQFFAGMFPKIQRLSSKDRFPCDIIRKMFVNLEEINFGQIESDSDEVSD